MNTYILLRNNKESCSLTLDALKQKGLKSTDLIWVECQSVCWQHPHEIAELKLLVVGDNTPTTGQAKNLALETSNNSSEITTETIAEKKRVLVEMPFSANSLKKQITADAVHSPQSDLAAINKYGGLTDSEKLPIEKSPDSASIKYSRPSDEIKEMYVKNLQQQKSFQNQLIDFKLPKQAKKIAVYAALVISGAAIMLLITNTGVKKYPITQGNLQQATSKNVDTLSTEPPDANFIAEPVYEQNESPADAIPLIPIEKKSSDDVTLKKSSVRQKGKEEIVTQDVPEDNIEKKNQDIKVATESKPVPAEAISSKLTLNANDYVVGSFGGIRNLEITLRNDSKYLLDKVTAELQYLNPEGVILKTENIYFQFVPAGETEKVAVNKTKRGVKIVYKVIKIESREVINGTAGL